MGGPFSLGGGPYFTGEYGPPGPYSPIEYGPRVHIQGGVHIQYDTGAGRQVPRPSYDLNEVDPNVTPCIVSVWVRG